MQSFKVLTKDKRMFIKNSWKQENGKYKCPFCKKEYTKNGISTHIWRSHGEGQKFHPVKKGTPPWNKNKKTGFSWNKGLKTGISTWDKISESKKNEIREKSRKNIQKRYAEGWNPKAGRAVKYKYKNFTVDGSWELEFCKWADENNILYERNQDRFDYLFEGIDRKYKPDFKLNDTLYIEIKGYQTEKDLAKWQYFPHSLIVLKRSQIDRIKKRTFKSEDLNKYILE